MRRRPLVRRRNALDVRLWASPTRNRAFSSVPDRAAAARPTAYAVVLGKSLVGRRRAGAVLARNLIRRQYSLDYLKVPAMGELPGFRGLTLRGKTISLEFASYEYRREQAIRHSEAL